MPDRRTCGVLTQSRIHVASDALLPVRGCTWKSQPSTVDAMHLSVPLTHRTARRSVERQYWSHGIRPAAPPPASAERRRLRCHRPRRGGTPGALGPRGLTRGESGNARRTRGPLHPAPPGGEALPLSGLQPGHPRWPRARRRGTGRGPRPAAPLAPGVLGSPSLNGDRFRKHPRCGPARRATRRPRRSGRGALHGPVRDPTATRGRRAATVPVGADRRLRRVPRTGPRIAP